MNAQPVWPSLTRTLLRARQRSTPMSSSPFLTHRTRAYHRPSHRTDRVHYSSTGLRLALNRSSGVIGRAASEVAPWGQTESCRRYSTDRDADRAGQPNSTSTENGDSDSQVKSQKTHSISDTNSATPGEPVVAETLSDGQPFLPPLPHAQTNYAPFIRRLLSRLPHPSKSSNPDPGLNDNSSSHNHNHDHQHGPHPHFRPTKDQLLAAATSFWQRLRIRWKWFSIRSWRRFNMDDWTAFGSWVLVGNSTSGFWQHESDI
jgi:hypothetical protein